MTQEINNENSEIEGLNEESQQEELQPVKSTPGKILSTGMKIIVGGGIVMLIGAILSPPRLMGSTQSSRLELEKRKAEFAQAIQAEKAKEEQSEITRKEIKVEHVK